jgi:hypothetical protein
MHPAGNTSDDKPKPPPERPQNLISFPKKMLDAEEKRFVRPKSAGRR